ncbi:MAG: TonB-dependent receptor [Pyrinomonadaceae bacterium]
MNIFIRKLFILCALMLACAVSVFAQTATGVSGRIIDPQGAAVSGATVTLYERARPSERFTTISNERGDYRFERLASGEYILETEARGFARAAARVLRIESNMNPTIDVQLELAGVSEQVVVTASSTAQPVDEVSKAITVVGRKEIDERDEFAVTDALRTVPGLRVQQLGGPGRLTSIRTRGLRSQDTAVLIDGLRFRDPSSINGDATSFLSDLVVTNLDRVEVLRGSGSSLYGTNAVGGVLNIVTDEGGGQTHGSLLAEGGGLGFFRGRAQIAGGVNADRFLYSAGVTHVNVSRGIDRDDAFRNTSGQGRGLFRLTPTATLSGRIYTGTSFVQLNSSPDLFGNIPASGIINAVPLSGGELRRFETGTTRAQLNAGGATFIPDTNDPDNSQADRFFSGALVFTQRPREEFGYTVSYQGLVTRRTNSNGPGGFGAFAQPFGGGTSRANFDGNIQTLNGRTDFRLGRFNFVNAGYEFENETFLNRSFSNNLASSSTVDTSQRSSTFFAQDQLRLMEDRLQLSAGFRAQFFSLDNPRFSPTRSSPYAGINLQAPPTAYTGDGSVAYLIRSSNTKLRAHVGNGYRAPSLFERFASSIGDPRLRPERTIAFDAGIDQSLFDNRVRASATYFYTRLQEVIGFGSVAANDPFGRSFAQGGFGGFLNTRGGLARGLELSATATPTRSLDLFTSYTYTNSDQRTPQLGGSGVLRTLVIPDHQFSLVATQRVRERFFVNFDLVATSNYLAPIFGSQTFSTRLYRFDGIVKADLGASYTLPFAGRKSIRFFGKVENLFDRDNFESGFRTPGRFGLAGAQLSF